MTQEQKDLLLKDLSARLPYGVKCEVIKRRIDGEMVYIQNGTDALELTVNNVKELITNNLYEIKPYLFPLSSMTDEQREEFVKYSDYTRREEDCGRHTELYYYSMVGHEDNLYPNYDSIDWLNAHHFDYRDLIEKGMAINATNLNIY